MMTSVVAKGGTASAYLWADRTSVRPLAGGYEPDIKKAIIVNDDFCCCEGRDRTSVRPLAGGYEPDIKKSHHCK